MNEIVNRRLQMLQQQREAIDKEIDKTLKWIEFLEEKENAKRK